MTVPILFEQENHVLAINQSEKNIFRKRCGFRVKNHERNQAFKYIWILCTSPSCGKKAVECGILNLKKLHCQRMATEYWSLRPRNISIVFFFVFVKAFGIAFKVIEAHFLLSLDIYNWLTYSFIYSRKRSIINCH